MAKASPAATADEIVLRHLTARLRASDRAVTRLRRNDILPEGHSETISVADWAAAAERLLDTGRILMFKINDLPGTLPLVSYSACGYATPEHLLGLLERAGGERAEELRDYLEYQGVAVPQVKPRTAVTAAQKKRIDSAVRSLNKVRAEIAARNPDNRVVWYLDASGTLNLMIEPDGQMEPDQQYVVHDARLDASGGGDW